MSNLNVPFSTGGERTPRTRGVSAMVRALAAGLTGMLLMFLLNFLFNFFMIRICAFLKRRRRKQHFKSATTGVATKTMRNELNRLVNTVTEPATRKVSFGFYPLEKSETRRIWMTGFRYGDAIVLLPLYALSRRESKAPGSVRVHVFAPRGVINPQLM